MSKVHEITRESWILSSFPEWGTWLNEEIETGSGRARHLCHLVAGLCRYLAQNGRQYQHLMDLWVKTGKRTQNNPWMKDQHQHQRAIGVKKLQPNLRNAVVPIDPFAIREPGRPAGHPRTQRPHRPQRGRRRDPELRRRRALHRPAGLRRPVDQLGRAG